MAQIHNGVTAEIGATGEDARLFFPITKVEKSEDGEARYVYGKATGPDLDLDKQIVDADFARTAFPQWFKSWGNIRQMHSKNLPPAGKAVELHEAEDGSQFIRAKIVEPGAIRLVDEGVYTAFSVGMNNVKVVKDLDAPGGRIVAGTFIETSLVDHPANPTCRFEVVKRASDGDEWEETQALELSDEADESVKSLVAEVSKVHVADYDTIALAVEKALTAERAKHAAEVEALKSEMGELQKKYDQLASEPDPAQAPFRGGKYVLTPGGAADAADPSEARKARDSQYRTYLEDMSVSHPDSAMRLRAFEQLSKLGEAS